MDACESKVVVVANTSAPPFGLSLGQLVEVAELGLRLVVGDEVALATNINWAHATEMTDPRPHLRGAELVCTVGSALMDAASCTRLVEAVHATGSAGICLGIGEVHTQTPLALIAECRRLSVPLIEMAHGVPFLAINDVLTDARTLAQTGTSQRNAELVSTLLVALREGAPIDQLLRLSEATLGGTLTTITTPEGNRLVWNGEPPAPHADLLGQISRILEIVWHEKDDHENQNRRRIGQLFALVAEGLADSAALLPELQAAGLNAQLLTVSAWPAETAPLLAAHLSGVLIADTPGATFMVTTGSAQVCDAARDLGLVCGYGTAVDVTQIARGIGQARATLGLARRHGKVAGPETLTTLTGLLEQQPLARLSPFVDQLILPLLGKDKGRGSQLMATLREFIEQNGALQATADSQYLHVNTVRHRLARIAVVVGRNPLDDNDRVSLAIALWAYDRSRRLSP